MPSERWATDPSPGAGLAARGRPPLSGAPTPLVARYRTGLVDLDGVVYRGVKPVPHATAALCQASAAGMRAVFVTNNASRTPAEVAALLRDIGLEASEYDVVTSAQAAARIVATLVPADSPVLVVGGSAMEQALHEERLAAVRCIEDAPRAVIQGLSPDVDWRQLAEAAYAVARGLPWVVSNMDSTVPRNRGIAPGNGALAEVIRIVTGRDPLVAGKPEPGLYLEALRRSSTGRPLAVGDRLDTDIAGARRIGMDSMLVLTGVTSAAELLIAPPSHRPTYVAADLRGLVEAHPPVFRSGRGWRCGRWTAEVVKGELALRPASADPAELDAVRALCRAAWAAQDTGHEVRLAAYVREALPGRARPGQQVGHEAALAQDRDSVPYGYAVRR